MPQLRFYLIIMVALNFYLPSNAQYKRRGEILQSRLNKASKPPKAADYKLEQLQGKWQEFERKDRNNNFPVSFTDSIQLKFTDSNKVITRTSTVSSMMMTGEAEIDEDNVLTTAADEYTIKSVSNNELVLDDNDLFIHRLKKVNSFWYETFGRIPVKQNDYSIPIEAEVPKMMGKWYVYRRKAKPGAITADIFLIKYFNITAKLNAATATGDIVFYNSQVSKQSACMVTLKGPDIKIVAGKNSWTFSVYQADADNFVFGNSKLLYFCKPSK
jgi:hypothetical protein